MLHRQTSHKANLNILDMLRALAASMVSRPQARNTVKATLNWFQELFLVVKETGVVRGI